VTPFDGSRTICAWIRSLTEGAARPARIQDPFGLRTFPQAHGPALDALAQLDDVVCRLANAPSENPVMLTSADDGDEVAHHGGFHAAYLASALQAAVAAITQSAKLNLARLTTLTDSDFTGLPAFLSDGTPGASGVMILEYVAASALADLRAAAAPAGLQTVVLSRGVEEDATFASQAARQAASAVSALRVLVGCELLAAVRAVRARGITPTNELLAQARGICDELPADMVDRDLTVDLERAQQLLPILAGVLPTT
jgi:histidine ammonia-lyase